MTTLFYIKNISKFAESSGKILPDYFGGRGKIGVKIHFGEPGNLYTFPPEMVGDFIGMLKAGGLEPFLFDSPVIYSSPRNSVSGYEQVLREKGFFEKELGCPAVISNNSKEFYGSKMDYRVCSDMINCDGQIILTHLKGHLATGFGGSIKNIGMGCLDRKTKGLTHSGGEPIYRGGCTLCGECERNCPTGHIVLGEDSPDFERSFCCGCSNCVYACDYDCLEPKVGYFDELLAEGASIALKQYGKPYFINGLFNMVERCDCDPSPGKVLVEDLGFIMGDDIVAVEKASYDLILENTGKDIYSRVHRISPLRHIEIAERLGMGSMKYELKEL